MENLKNTFPMIGKQIYLKIKKNIGTKKSIAIPKSSLGQAPTFAVVLLHGLYAKADELKPIAAKTDEKFGNRVLIIQPTCRARRKSITRSIAHQAQEVFDQIQLELIRYNKEPTSFPIIIIGYSQGGVLACTLGKAYKSQLHMVGIVTLNAPLMGTPLLERSPRDVQEFISKAAKGLQLIDPPLSNIKRNMYLKAWILTLIRPRWVPVPINGLRDIFPNSGCIKGINSFLRDNADIPCLLIATHQNDFGALFDIKAADHHRAIEDLNDAYAQLITGKKGGKHDTLIPLASQLGRGDRLNDLTNIDMNDPATRYIATVMPNRPKIKGRIYKGILHASNLIGIDADLFVDYGETVLYSDLILTDLVEFIERLVK